MAADKKAISNPNAEIADRICDCAPASARMRPPTAAPTRNAQRAVRERATNTSGTPTRTGESEKYDVSGHVCREHMPQRKEAHGVDHTRNRGHPKQRIGESLS